MLKNQYGELAVTLDIKLNARIMLTVIIVLQGRLGNGQLGTVKNIALNSQNNFWKNYVKADDYKVGLKEMNTDNFARQNLWVPIKKTTVDIRIKSNKNSFPVIKTQFPLMLALTCKVQGLSLNKIAVGIQLRNQNSKLKIQIKQRNIYYGQMYVALSRVNSFEWLYILGPFNLKFIRVSLQAFQEYSRHYL